MSRLVVANYVKHGQLCETWDFWEHKPIEPISIKLIMGFLILKVSHVSEPPLLHLVRDKYVSIIH